VEGPESLTQQLPSGSPPHFGTNINSEIQLKKKQTRITVCGIGSSWRNQEKHLKACTPARRLCLPARQLARQMQGHAGLFAALGLVQACAAQAGIGTAFIKSTNHAIIPGSVRSTLTPLRISDHLESAGSSLRASWEAEQALLPYSPIARKGPPLPRDRDAGVGGHMSGQQQCPQGGK